MKKLLSIILVISIIFCSISICFAADNITSTIENGVLTVSGTGKLTKTWSSDSTITSVIIEEGITSLPANVFSGCTNLKEIKLPSTLKNIDKYAFKKCKSLSYIDIPNSVETIGYGAFWSSGLIEITIPGSVKNLSNNAIYSCSNLTTITIESGVETLGTYSCGWNKKLTTLNIPNTLTSIGDNVIYNYSTTTVNYFGTIEEFNKINLNNNTALTVNCQAVTANNIIYECLYDNTTYKLTDDGILTVYGNGAAFNFKATELPEFINYVNDIKTIKIEDGITSVGDYTFAKLTNIETVILPSSVKSLGNYTFYNCSKLTDINLDNIESIGNYCFYGCESLTSIPSTITAGYCATEFNGNNQLAFNKSYSYYNSIINYLNNVYLNNDELAFDIDYCSSEDIEELTELAKYITKGCSTDEEKCTAIYNWIKDNIEVRYSNIGYSAIDVFRIGAGLCSGHSQLMSALFKLSGIRSTILRGYKEDTTYVNLNFNNENGYKYSHEWTLAYYNNEWHLFDDLWNFCGISDVNEMAHWYFPIHVDGIAVYTPDVMNFLEGNCLYNQTYYINNDYVCYIQDTINTSIGNNTLQVGGCLRYEKVSNNGYAIDEEFYNNHYINDLGITVQGKTINNEYLATTCSEIIKADESIFNNGLSSSMLNMYVGEVIDFTDIYAYDFWSENPEIVSISGSALIANCIGTVKINTKDNTAGIRINVYGDIINSNELFQELCDHDCAHHVNGKDYCDYCGKEIIAEEIIATPETTAETTVIEELIPEIINEEVINEIPEIKEEINEETIEPDRESAPESSPEVIEIKIELPETISENASIKNIVINLITNIITLILEAATQILAAI